MARIICVFVILTSCLSLTGADDEARKELKALQGKWKVATIEAAGMPLPKGSFPAFTWVIREDGNTTAQMPAGDFPVTLTLDPKKNPKAFVNLHGSGEQQKKQYGIYKLDGDTLTVCQTLPGAAETDRPTDFTTKGTNNVVIVFERVKEEKKP